MEPALGQLQRVRPTVPGGGPEGGMVEAGRVAGQVVGGQVGRGLWKDGE